MTDTSPEIEQVYRAKLVARSSEKRFNMGAQMLENARKMIKASLPRGLSETEQKRELFRRTYGTETGLEKSIWA